MFRVSSRAKRSAGLLKNFVRRNRSKVRSSSVRFLRSQRGNRIK